MGYTLSGMLFYGFDLEETDSEGDYYNEELTESIEEWEDRELASNGIYAPDHDDYKAWDWPGQGNDRNSIHSRNESSFASLFIV